MRLILKAHITPDESLRLIIQEGLRQNDGYCPCTIKSKGKPEYKCVCEDFRLNVPAGQTCHCGLYIKDEQ